MSCSSKRNRLVGSCISTFVIGRDGTLAREWRKVKVPGHAREVLDFVKTL
jgi:peroxiredoxin